MTERSVLVKMAGRAFSYLIPPGENPVVGDWVLPSLSMTREAAHVASQLHCHQIVAIEDPANPKATKMYFACFTTEFLETRQAMNIMRAKVEEPEPMMKVGDIAPCPPQSYTTSYGDSGKTEDDAKKAVDAFVKANPSIFKFWKDKT